jgi:6-phosphogluconolactonase
VGTTELRVLDAPAAAAGELLAEATGHVALSGGGTVGRAYRHAAALRQDWHEVTCWYGDERAVPPQHEDSNHRLACESLLDLVRTPPEVHRIEGELGAEEAARRYEQAFAGVTLALALNGIGPDGHTASLFPGAPGLAETERRVVAAEAGLEPFVPRVTMTPPAFADAALLVYLVAGDAKADAVRRAFVDEPSEQTPASLIRGRDTLVLLDAAAASGL